MWCASGTCTVDNDTQLELEWQQKYNNSNISNNIDDIHKYDDDNENSENSKSSSSGSNDDNSLQAFQLVVLFKYLLGVPKP